LLASDHQSISDALDNKDYVSLEKSGNKLEADARMKLEESKKCKLPSSTRQYAKGEYEAALEQFTQAGKYSSSAGRKMQAVDTTGADVDLNTFQSCQNVAGGHMQNILTYYQGQNGMASTQSGISSGVIASWSGNSIKHTETFHVSSDE
jgi:hypothetical protein